MTGQRDRLGELTAQGVSIWLDDIGRERLASGSLAALVRESHVRGVTSNPTIFEHSMTHGNAYDAQLHDLALRGVCADEASRAMTTFDIRWGCDLLRPVYEESGGIDGRVSIEVDPRNAFDTDKTIAEARALWWLVDRPNLFVKIPATESGLPAITACLAEGISINVTLIFSIKRYEAVIDAFMAGLEAASDADVAKLASVASFFVSRVDTEVDKRLDALGTPDAKALRGKAAVANARLAYEIFERRFGLAGGSGGSSPRADLAGGSGGSSPRADTADRWRALQARGARQQRPLWASTSTKDPAYRDTLYVDDLVAPRTVNTMPEPTIHAVADHGTVDRNTIAGTYDESRAVFADLENIGISYDDVVAVLEKEGVSKFSASWDGVLSTIRARLDDGQ